MKKTLKNLNYGTAILMGNLFYFSTICIHLLILTGIIPMGWISGGRITSFSEQIQISVFNLSLGVSGLLFIQWANHSRDSSSVRLVALTLSIVWGVSLVLQFLGTPFEIFFMSLIVLCGLISHLRLSINN